MILPGGRFAPDASRVVVQARVHLPFGALPEPSRDGGADPLIVNHEVVAVPSASVLALIRRDAAGRPPAAKTLSVLADPVFSPQDGRVLQHRMPLLTLATSPCKTERIHRSSSGREATGGAETRGSVTPWEKA